MKKQIDLNQNVIEINKTEIKGENQFVTGKRKLKT